MLRQVSRTGLVIYRSHVSTKLPLRLYTHATLKEKGEVLFERLKKYFLGSYAGFKSISIRNFSYYRHQYSFTPESTLFPALFCLTAFCYDADDVNSKIILSTLSLFV